MSEPDNTQAMKIPEASALVFTGAEKDAGAVSFNMSYGMCLRTIH